MNIISKNWSTEDWETFTHYLKVSLLESNMTIVFTKLDGTERTIHCTLNPSVLPPKDLTEGKTRKEKSTDVISVFDLEKKEWRSFHVKNVKSVAFEHVDKK
jgi:hypothetical protein